MRSHTVTTESTRKLVHLSALLIPVLSELTSKPVVLIALSVITISYLIEEVLRCKGQRVPLLTSFTLRLSRPEEEASFNIRPADLAIGIILALVLYPSTIAYAAIVVAAVGDSVAATVGRAVGRRHIIGRKTLEGFAAGFAASSLAAFLLVPPVVALTGAAGGMFMELLDVPDDNLTMPIVAGAWMMIVTLVLR